MPPDSALWNCVEQTAREVFADYGFGEIRLPIFEQTELFARSIGADTDVVAKEMYTFESYENVQSATRKIWQTSSERMMRSKTRGRITASLEHLKM